MSAGENIFVHLRLDIEMDGGIGLENLRGVLSAGVNVVVAGSAIFYKDETEARARGFMEAINIQQGGI